MCCLVASNGYATAVSSRTAYGARSSTSVVSSSGRRCRSLHQTRNRSTTRLLSWFRQSPRSVRCANWANWSWWTQHFRIGPCGTYGCRFPCLIAHRGGYECRSSSVCPPGISTPYGIRASRKDNDAGKRGQLTINGPIHPPHGVLSYKLESLSCVCHPYHMGRNGPSAANNIHSHRSSVQSLLSGILRPACFVNACASSPEYSR